MVNRAGMERAEADLPITGLLAEQTCGLSSASLPDWVQQLAKQCLLDWLAVTVAGAREPLVEILLQEIQGQGGKPEASLIGQGGKVATQQAALLNGAASHALDYDDVHMHLSGHPTVTIVPGLLALAESRGASGADFIAAFVAGYEVACRIGAAVAPGHYARGFHSTATVGSFASAAACGRLLGLDARQMAAAFGIAGTQAAGLKSMFGTMCKPLHAGKAAQNGLFAASLAARGFTSRDDVLECAQGFAATQTDSYKPRSALAEPKDGFHIRANLFKYHAACYLTHAAIECGRRLRDQHHLDADAITAVTLKIDSGADKVCNIPTPRTGLEAKFSLRLTSAFALAGVDTAGLDNYSDAMAADPNLVALRDKVRVELMPDWSTTVTEMRVDLADGRSLATRHDSGIPAADLDEQGRRVEAKFHSLADPILGRARAERLAALVADLEHLPNLAGLVRECLPAANA